MKIASFNVNSLKMRLGIVCNWLGQHQPDILMIQEIKGAEIPAQTFHDLGYHVQSVTQKAYNGVATLTRAQASVIHTALPGMVGDDQARFLSVSTAQENGAPLHVINIYAPNGNPIGTEKYAYKLRWLEALYHHLADLRRAEHDVVIAGDFNIIPERLDAAHPDDWRGDALFQDQVRALYRAILHLGYSDSLRLKYPETPDLYSFWDYQAGAWARNNGIRIDHVLLSPRLADRLSDVVIDRTPRGQDKPSDHTPILVALG